MESCPPLYATERDPAADTLGGQVAQLAAMLGQEFMPWQRYVADVALEIRPDGLPKYREVVLTIPRQSGKSFLIFVLLLHRILGWADQPQRAVYCSQSLNDGLHLLNTEFWPKLSASGAVDLFGLRHLRSQSAAGIEAKSGSGFRLISGAAHAGHGGTMGLAVVDEAWAFRDETKEQALLPSLNTVRDAQFWAVSTAGDETSIWLSQKVEAGRDRVRNGIASRSAFFEWGAPEEADWTDPSVWELALPALGWTQHLEDVAHLQDTMGESEFRRASLNQRPAENKLDSPIPWPSWVDACSDRAAIPPSAPIVLCADAPPTRHCASIAVAGGGVIEVLRHSEGTDWVEASVLGAVDSQPISKVVLMRGGTLEHLAGVLEAKRVEVMLADRGVLAAGCGQLYDDVVGGKVAIRQSEVLSDALISADKKHRVGSWHWWQRPRRAPITPLIAATFAHYMSVREGWVPVLPMPSVASSADYASDTGFDALVSKWKKVR